MLTRFWTFFYSACCCLLSLPMLGQQYQGFNSSNYSGITSIYENPANLADSRYLLDINLIGLDANLNNNYIAFNTALLASNNNPIADTIYYDAFQQFRQDHFFEQFWGDLSQARLHQSINVQGPSAQFTIGKNGFAITSAVRQYFHLDNLDPRTADFLLSELEDPVNWNVDLDNQKFNVLGAAWAEFGVGYGREIVNTGEHFLKGGAHLRILVAMYSAYFYADQLQLNFKNSDTLRVRVSDVRFGYSDDMSYIRADMETQEVNDFFANIFNRAGFAADFGFVYEWRPNHKKYADANKEGAQVKYENKYKLKAGFSVSDIGGLTFDRGSYAGNFSGFSVDWDLDTFAAASQGVEDFGELMSDTFSMNSSREAFSLRLPTTIGLQVDYNIWKWFYVNLSARFALDQDDSPLKMHALNTFSLTPRFEMPMVDVGLPVNIDGYGNLTAGLYARVGPVFVGSTNCWNMIVGPSVRGVNIYGGLKIPIAFKKKKPKKLPPVEEEDLSQVPPPPQNTTPMPVEEMDKEDLGVVAEDTAAIKARQEEIDRKIVSDKEWAAQQELKRRQVEIVTTTPEPKPEPQPEPKPEPEETPAPVIEQDYYEVKTTEVAVDELKAYFKSGQAALDTTYKKMLDGFVTQLLADPNYHAVIHGHTDNVGNPDDNKALAAKRANKVRDYLIQKGIDGERLSIIAEGSNKPAAENNTAAGREMNRRVEILLLKDK